MVPDGPGAAVEHTEPLPPPPPRASAALRCRIVRWYGDTHVRQQEVRVGQRARVMKEHPARE